MTPEDYNNIKKVYQKDFDDRIRQLQREFALANNPFKIGDIIESYQGRLLIDKITIEHSMFSLPSCVYKGLKLKKDNTPFKNGERISAYQSNDITKIN